MNQIDNFISEGTKRWFEYQCFESHDSEHAELWYRSHRQVTVGKCRNPEYGQWSQSERYEDCTPLVYHIQFDDGFEQDAFEYELMTSQDQFERPDPPVC